MEGVQLSGIATVLNHDVLSGRGNNINSHTGNRYFRELVSALRIQYVATPKAEKPLFAKVLITQIRGMNPSGRFLKQGKNELWEDIGEKKAIDKTRQALREGAPEIVEKIKNGELVVEAQLMTTLIRDQSRKVYRKMYAQEGGEDVVRRAFPDLSNSGPSINGSMNGSLNVSSTQPMEGFPNGMQILQAQHAQAQVQAAMNQQQSSPGHFYDINSGTRTNLSNSFMTQGSGNSFQQQAQMMRNSLFLATMDANNFSNSMNSMNGSMNGSMNMRNSTNMNESARSLFMRNSINNSANGSMNGSMNSSMNPVFNSTSLNTLSNSTSGQFQPMHMSQLSALGNSISMNQNQNSMNGSAGFSDSLSPEVNMSNTAVGGGYYNGNRDNSMPTGHNHSGYDNVNTPSSGLNNGHGHHDHSISLNDSRPQDPSQKEEKKEMPRKRNRRVSILVHEFVKDLIREEDENEDDDDAVIDPYATSDDYYNPSKIGSEDFLGGGSTEDFPGGDDDGKVGTEDFPGGGDDGKAGTEDFPGGDDGVVAGTENFSGGKVGGHQGHASLPNGDTNRGRPMGVSFTNGQQQFQPLSQRDPPPEEDDKDMVDLRGSFSRASLSLNDVFQNTNKQAASTAHAMTQAAESAGIQHGRRPSRRSFHASRMSLCSRRSSRMSIVLRSSFLSSFDAGSDEEDRAKVSVPDVFKSRADRRKSILTESTSQLITTVFGSASAELASKSPQRQSFLLRDVLNPIKAGDLMQTSIGDMDMSFIDDYDESDLDMSQYMMDPSSAEINNFVDRFAQHESDRMNRQYQMESMRNASEGITKPENSDDWIAAGEALGRARNTARSKLESSGISDRTLKASNFDDDDDDDL